MPAFLPGLPCLQVCRRLRATLAAAAAAPATPAPGSSPPSAPGGGDSPSEDLNTSIKIQQLMGRITIGAPMPRVCVGGSSKGSQGAPSPL